MENAVEALKIAFGVMIFVLALSISISSFSQANSAVQSIVMLRDRETDYTYVAPTKEFTRKVGIETIIPTMYKAYIENMEIYFFKEDGITPLILYYKTDQLGNKMTDEDGEFIAINYIDLARESLANKASAKQHLDIILSVGEDNRDLNNEMHKKYWEQFKDGKGIYEEFKDYEFKEELGEYYQSSGGTKIKKRVITYTLCNNE